MSKPTYLMCYPGYYSVDYQINNHMRPWAQDEKSAKRQAAIKQWFAIKRKLEELGGNVHVMAQRDGLPDQVFATDPMVTLDDLVIFSKFRHAEREQESIAVLEYLNNSGGLRGKCIHQMQEELEGGDLLYDPEKQAMIIGHGFRTSAAAVAEVESAITKAQTAGYIDADVDVMSLQLVDEDLYHLDVCFCPFKDGYAMYVPEAFDSASQAKLKQRYGDGLIPVSKEDAMAFVCNGVVMDDHFVTSDGISDDLRSRLEGFGYQVHPLDVSLFIEAGGSVHCLVKHLDEKSIPSLNLRRVA